MVALGCSGCAAQSGPEQLRTGPPKRNLIERLGTNIFVNVLAFSTLSSPEQP